MDSRTQEIIKECKRQQDSCNYTSTAMYSWIKEIRIFRFFLIVAPIIFATVASAKILFNPTEYWIPAIAALIAGMIPAIFKALDLDQNLQAMSNTARGFETLRDRFRQASLIGATGNTEDLEISFKELMDRMDMVRASSFAIPERHFKIAQKKIGDGHYTFEIDSNDKSSH